MLPSRRSSPRRAERVVAREIAASTAAKYAESFIALREVLGSQIIDEIDVSATRRAFTELTARRGRYAANRALSVLRLALRVAMQRGYRDQSAPDPVAAVTKHRETRRGVQFSSDELARIGVAIAEEEARRPEARDTIAAIRLLALTGARRREITSLAWGEVDLA